MLPLNQQFGFTLFLSGLLALLCFYLFRRLRNFVLVLMATQRSGIDRINDLLPQTQCGKCGYEGCRPYAKAIFQGEAINHCPPGGTHTIARLSLLLNEVKQGLDPRNGEELAPSIAVIREEECIGCTKCIQACPVDAIFGAAKLMHTVVARECTGCDLCVEPCPVDCIDMVTSESPIQTGWELPVKIIDSQSSQGYIS